MTHKKEIASWETAVKDMIYRLKHLEAENADLRCMLDFTRKSIKAYKSVKAYKDANNSLTRRLDTFMDSDDEEHSDSDDEDHHASPRHTPGTPPWCPDAEAQQGPPAWDEAEGTLTWPDGTKQKALTT